jgi:outer membrane lipase/esterase
MAFHFKKVLAAACASTVLSSAAMAQEFRLDRMFVIGDSLSDGGTYTQSSTFVLAGGGETPPSLTNPDFRFRFTNNAADGSSQTYAEVLADSFGIELEPNLITGVPAAAGSPLAPLAADIPVGGTNYAQGGARVQAEAAGQNDPLNATGVTPTLLGITQTPALAQIEGLLSSNDRFSGSDLIVVWAGANDVLTLERGIDGGQLTDAQADFLIDQTAGQLVSGIDDILERGPANVIVVTVPDIGRNTPRGQAAIGAGGIGPDAAEDLTRLTEIYNTRLRNGVGGRVALVDSDAVLSAVLDNPARYGFSDIGELQRQLFACTDTAVQCVQPGAGGAGININTDPRIANLDLVFADPVHPTERAHNVLAQIAVAALIDIGQIGVMPVATISALRQQSQGLEQRLNLGAFFINDEAGNRVRRPVGNVEVYGGAELGFYESDPQQVVPGFDGRTQVIKAAADVMVTENVMVGAGLSLDHGQVEFDDDRGGFDSRLVVGGVFGVAQIVPGVYVNGFLGGGIIESIDVDRSYGINDIARRGGQRLTTERFEADTDGTYFIARANVGAVLPVGNGFFVNPSAGFAFERVDIDGYSESARNGSMEAAQATVGDLEYEGHRGTLALGGFYRPPSDPTWTFGLRGSWEHDFNNDDIEVPFALGASPLNVQTAPRPDDSYGLVSVTVVKELSHATSMNLQASRNVAQNGVEGYTFGLNFKHTF